VAMVAATSLSTNSAFTCASIQRLSPWRASGVPSWLYRSFQEYLGGAKPSPDSVDLPGWAFIACCAAISSFTYSVGLANRPPCWTALSRMNSTPSAYLLGHSASLAPEVASGGKPDQMGNSPYAASQKAASGSAPRRRESSVEEGSTRIIVDRSGSWRAAWSGNWPGRSLATKVALGD